MNGHEHYQELAALAAGGQLSGGEYADFKSHLDDCESCRREFAEYEDMLFNQFPVVELNDRTLRGPNGFFSSRAYKERFVAHARANGIPISGNGQRARSWWEDLSEVIGSPLVGAYGAVLILCGFAGLLGYRIHELQGRQLATDREAEVLQEKIAAVKGQNSTLEKHLSDLSKENVDTTELRTQLTGAKVQYSELVARYARVEAELKDASSRSQAMRTEMQAGYEREHGLVNKLKETESSLAKVTQDFQKLSHSADSARTADTAFHLRDLEIQLADANESLDKAKRLLAADHDIRDLMGARNLHITDVFDVDDRGKTKKPFGRVFYTEGKSLIFYAFDLGKSRNAPLDRAYQVWGFQEAGGDSAQSLGILFQDDLKQNRWVLKFNDAAVLAGIDAMFVTSEPRGGSRKPTGQKILYAYLGAKPNHP
jgi:hypothetical protein